jgi:hypothetical protein
LFSSSEVAEYINKTFEPAWESVRPAPLVTIDFGNGNVVKRTLQGNIATYVCGADGIVYDLLPGIYAPDVYRKQLEALATLAKSLQVLQPKPGTKPAADQRVARLRDYHNREAADLGRRQPTPQVQSIAQIGGSFKGGIGGGFGGYQITGGNFGGANFGNFGGANFGNMGGYQFGGGFQISGSFSGSGVGTPGLGGIEGPTERVIAGLPLPPTPPAAAGAKPQVPLAVRPELALDSQVNEQIRRKAVHEHLARAGAVRPDDIKKWLFKEVLRADLDDPLLGLGPVLNANYPFAEEDKAARR